MKNPNRLLVVSGDFTSGFVRVGKATSNHLIRLNTERLKNNIIYKFVKAVDLRQPYLFWTGYRFRLIKSQINSTVPSIPKTEELMQRWYDWAAPQILLL